MKRIALILILQNLWRWVRYGWVGRLLVVIVLLFGFAGFLRLVGLTPDNENSTRPTAVPTPPLPTVNPLSPTWAPYVTPTPFQNIPIATPIPLDSTLPPAGTSYTADEPFVIGEGMTLLIVVVVFIFLIIKPSRKYIIGLIAGWWIITSLFEAYPGYTVAALVIAAILGLLYAGTRVRIKG